jgi:hypothetical protein
LLPPARAQLEEQLVTTRNQAAHKAKLQPLAVRKFIAELNSDIFIWVQSHDDYAEKLRFNVYVDPGDAPAELITELYLALSALHKACGGEGLSIVNEERRSLVGEVL